MNIQINQLQNFKKNMKKEIIFITNVVKDARDAQENANTTKRTKYGL